MRPDLECTVFGTKALCQGGVTFSLSYCTACLVNSTHGNKYVRGRRAVFSLTGCIEVAKYLARQFIISRFILAGGPLLPFNLIIRFFPRVKIHFPMVVNSGKVK
jgi:hypothetical protein